MGITACPECKTCWQLSKNKAFQNRIELPQSHIFLNPFQFLLLIIFQCFFPGISQRLFFNLISHHLSKPVKPGRTHYLSQYEMLIYHHRSPCCISGEMSHWQRNSVGFKQGLSEIQGASVSALVCQSTARVAALQSRALCH